MVLTGFPYRVGHPPAATLSAAARYVAATLGSRLGRAAFAAYSAAVANAGGVAGGADGMDLINMGPPGIGLWLISANCASALARRTSSACVASETAALTISATSTVAPSAGDVSTTLPAALVMTGPRPNIFASAPTASSSNHGSWSAS